MEDNLTRNSITSITISNDDEGEPLLQINATAAIIPSTKNFLPQWKSTSGHVTLPVHLALMSFIQQASFSDSEESRTFFRSVSALTFGLNSEAWSRILNDLELAGLFSTVHDNEHSFYAAVASAPIQKEVHIIQPEDTLLGEPFTDTAGGSSGARARARATTSADDAPINRQGSMRFLSLASVLDFSAAKGLPLSPLCRLMGTLGPCRTQSSRMNELSSVRVASSIILHGILSSLDLGGTTPDFDAPVIAAHLPEFILAIELPWLLKGCGSSPSDLVKELTDGIRSATRSLQLPRARTFLATQPHPTKKSVRVPKTA